MGHGDSDGDGDDDEDGRRQRQTGEDGGRQVGMMAMVMMMTGGGRDRRGRTEEADGNDFFRQAAIESRALGPESTVAVSVGPRSRAGHGAEGPLAGGGGSIRAEGNSGGACCCRLKEEEGGTGGKGVVVLLWE